MLQGLGEQGIPLPLLGDEGGAVACQQLQQRRAAKLARVRVRATVGLGLGLGLGLGIG